MLKLCVCKRRLPNYLTDDDTDIFSKIQIVDGGNLTNSEKCTTTFTLKMWPFIRIYNWTFYGRNLISLDE